MDTLNDPPENPYAAPQAELAAAKPKVIYIKKFNGKLAFWSGLAICLTLLFLGLPAVQSDRYTQQSIAREILFLIAISIGMGLFLGSISGRPTAEQDTETESEKPQTDEPPS